MPALVGAAPRHSSHGKPATRVERKGTLMPPSPAWIVQQIGPKPRGTCGFMGETYVSDRRIPAEALAADYQGSRAFGGVFYFLVTPQAPVRLHPIRSDHMYHHYLGDP